MDFAPIVMISFNRSDLVSMSMRNVSLANGVEHHDIYMFIDGPREGNVRDLEENNRIFQIVSAYRERLPRLRIIRREKNYGCRGNIVDAITQIITKYGRSIIIEDDILISRTFLEYMNQALSFYECDKRIWSINAYQSPYLQIPKDYPYDVYLNPVNMCWGWGTWSDRWCQVDFDLTEWPTDKEKREIVEKLNRAGRQIIPMLEAQYAGRLKTWDVQCTYYAVKHGLMSVEPRFQLSKNIGFLEGVAGEHCAGAMPIITRQRYYNFLPRLVEGLQADERIGNQFEWIVGSKNLFVRVWRKLARMMATVKPKNMMPYDVKRRD